MLLRVSSIIMFTKLGTDGVKQINNKCKCIQKGGGMGVISMQTSVYSLF